MRIQVHLFAAAAQIAQARAVCVELAAGSTLAQLAREVETAHPELTNLLAISRWAVDHQFVTLDSVVSEQQEIAMIPPVSGG